MSTPALSCTSYGEYTSYQCNILWHARGNKMLNKQNPSHPEIIIITNPLLDTTYVCHVFVCISRLFITQCALLRVESAFPALVLKLHKRTGDSQETVFTVCDSISLIEDSLCCYTRLEIFIQISRVCLQFIDFE